MLETRGAFVDPAVSNLLAAPSAPRPITSVPAPAPAPAKAQVTTYDSSVDNILAMPSGSAVNSSVALTGSEYSPPTPSGSNDPGLNSTSVFQNAPEGTSKMSTTHWLLVAVAIVAVIWALFHYGILGSSAAAA